MSKLLCLLAALIISAHAVSISWTGYGGDNQWTNKVNWSPDQVPSTGDDVEISSGVVQVTIATGVNSLVMGDSFNAPANITIFQTFFIGSGGLQVQGNGNLFINAGTAQVTGSVTIGGTLYFQSGALSGVWQITSRGVADLSGSSQKALLGCQFTSQASSFVLGGVLALNQSSQVVVQTSLIMSGDVSIQLQDTSSVLLDTSAGSLTYTGGGTLQIQAPVNIGTFNFQGGNLTIYDEMSFVHPFAIPSGSYVATVGSAVVNMSLGVSGAGILSAAGSVLTLGNTSVSTMNIVGGNVSFNSAGSNIPLLTISGGYTFVNYAISTAQLNLMSGNLVGPAAVTASMLYFNTQGFNLGGPVSVTSTASLGGLLAFATGGSLTFASTATVTASSSLTFTGVPGATVTNNGAFMVSAPVTFQNIDLAGSGSSSVSASLSIQTATVSQNTVTLTGSGNFVGSNTQIVSIASVKGSPNVRAVIGTYSIKCPKECDSVSTNGVPTNSFTFKVGQ
jgi:hypothetical protein